VLCDKRSWSSLLLSRSLALLLDRSHHGRSQLSLVSDSEVMGMSYQEYDKFLKSNTLSTDKNATEMVRRVVERSRKRSKPISRRRGQQSARRVQVEFNLIEGRTSTPGHARGKVVVYTGILPYTKTETGLAVVMGHEIAHAIAKHGQERMSQQLATQLGATALDAALASKPQETRGLR